MALWKRKHGLYPSNNFRLIWSTDIFQHRQRQDADNVYGCTSIMYTSKSIDKCKHINCLSLKYISSNWLGAGVCESVQCFVLDSSETMMTTKATKRRGKNESKQLRKQTNAYTFTPHIPEHIRHRALISNEAFKIHRVVPWKLALNLFKIDRI